MNLYQFTLQQTSVLQYRLYHTLLISNRLSQSLEGLLKHFKSFKCGVSGLHCVVTRVKQYHLENAFRTSFLPLEMLVWSAEE